jgi:hypothetical protein
MERSKRAGSRAFVAVLAAVLATLTGCGGDEPLDGLQVHEYDELVEEWRAHTTGLTLPPGVQWHPPREPDLEPDAQGVLRGHVYEQGSGKSMADHYWWCAWAQEWLDTRGHDADREQVALTTLHTFKESFRYHQSFDEHSREFTDRLLEQADLGDPGPLANFVALNCHG